MRNIRIDIQYDGTNYSGWQFQTNAKSIQEIIHKALHKILKTNIKIIGAGRTDAKVHAIHQVANFFVESKIPEDRFKIAINSLIPKDIRIIDSFEVNENFNSRFSAKKRTYLYMINNSQILSPFIRNYRWNIKHSIDINIDKLKRILSPIIGENDFTNLCSIDDNSYSKIRNIHNITIKKRADDILIFISANAFLRKMIRIIIGTSIKILLNNYNENLLEKILHSKDRSKFIFSAPPQGLFLYKIIY